MEPCSGLDIDSSLPLHAAICGEHKRRLRVLLECGADICAVDEHDRTVLHWACSTSAYDYSADPDYDFVGMLVERGGDQLLNAQDAEGEHYALPA